MRTNLTNKSSDCSPKPVCFICTTTRSYKDSSDKYNTYFGFPLRAINSILWITMNRHVADALKMFNSGQSHLKNLDTSVFALICSLAYYITPFDSLSNHSFCKHFFCHRRIRPLIVFDKAIKRGKNVSDFPGLSDELLSIIIHFSNRW